MRISLLTVAVLALAAGCSRDPIPPLAEDAPVANPAPAAAPASDTAAAAVPSADDRALQTLRDLGVTPETMLQLVRNQLANSMPAADSRPQPLPEPSPAPQASLPTPQPAAVPAAPATPATETPFAGTTPPPEPEAERPVADAASPAVLVVTNTVVVREPVIVQQVSDFYAPLNTYGTWVDLPVYGRCWQPTITMVNGGWRPYCHGGRWVYTDTGWYWQSDYSWGWAPFHYGRWCYLDRYRWVWIPDTVWAPAWVSWRRSDTHCGWAPLPPGTAFRAGVGFSFGRDVQFDIQFNLTAQHYTFVPNGQFCDRSIATVAISSDQIDAIYRRSTYVPESHTWDNRSRRVRDDGPGRDLVPRRAPGQPPPPPARVVTAPPPPATQPRPFPITTAPGVTTPTPAPRPAPIASAPVTPHAPTAPVVTPPVVLPPAEPERPVVTTPVSPSPGRRHQTEHSATETRRESPSSLPPEATPVERTSGHGTTRDDATERTVHSRDSVPTRTWTQPSAPAPVRDVTPPAATPAGSEPAATRDVPSPSTTHRLFTPPTVRDVTPSPAPREATPPVVREVATPMIVPVPRGGTAPVSTPVVEKPTVPERSFGSRDSRESRDNRDRRDSSDTRVAPSTTPVAPVTVNPRGAQPLQPAPVASTPRAADGADSAATGDSDGKRSDKDRDGDRRLFRR